MVSIFSRFNSRNHTRKSARIQMMRKNVRFHPVSNAILLAFSKWAPKKKGNVKKTIVDIMQLDSLKKRKYAKQTLFLPFLRKKIFAYIFHAGKRMTSRAKLINGNNKGIHFETAVTSGDDLIRSNN